MSDISEKSWKAALISIVEQLSESDYKKMLVLMSKIKQCERNKPKEEMAETIIQSYGVKESITEIRNIMEEIPRKDDAVQKLLKPFVDKLKAGKKTGFKRNKCVSESESSDEDQETDCGEVGSRQPDQQSGVQSWRKTIEDVKRGGGSGQKLVSVMVMQKSGLRTYKTKQKELKFFFYLGVADETSSCKVMVYGRERYEYFEGGRCYGLRDVIMDDKVMKVTKMSKVSKTIPVSVPEDLQLQAKMIIYTQAPLCSVAEAKQLTDRTTVSVEGTVTEVGVQEKVKVKSKRRKTDRLQFRLTDDTDSIQVTLWGDDTHQLRGTSHGDFVQVTNVKTNDYNDTVSLNSTDFTRIFQVQKAAMHRVSMEIIGIISAGKFRTELESQISSQVSTYVVDSPLLAKAFGVKLEGDFEDRLLRQLPLRAEAAIQGNKISEIKAAKEM